MYVICFRMLSIVLHQLALLISSSCKQNDLHLINVSFNSTDVCRISFFFIIEFYVKFKI